ncbi:hypothetical protein KIPB_006971 [Kipferlia bialata]|uniref:Uncharacterized protein n=1 Tax=Kipferlia bialata TaxID=797122 RepID=A0A9K3D128_9EUKA|nr:hypothetical protein KIPB_006971 [Kipferlia bialata]|eukprot:g6971.t1
MRVLSVFVPSAPSAYVSHEWTGRLANLNVSVTTDDKSFEFRSYTSCMLSEDTVLLFGASTYEKPESFLIYIDKDRLHQASVRKCKGRH